MFPAEEVQKKCRSRSSEEKVHKQEKKQERTREKANETNEKKRRRRGQFERDEEKGIRETGERCGSGVDL